MLQTNRLTSMKSMVRMILRSPRRSIGTRLFVLFICIVTILVGGVGIVSYRIAGSSLLDQIEYGMEQTITLAGEKLDMKQQFYLDLSKQLMNNSSFTENLFQIVIPDLKVDERDRRLKELQDLLDQLALSDPHIRDISLIPMEDPIDPISTKREGMAFDREAAWSQQIVQASGKPAWLPVVPGGYAGGDTKSLFAYGQILGRTNVGSHDFLLLVQVEESVLLDMIRDVKVSPGAVTAIMDGMGQVIISNNPEAAIAPFVSQGSRQLAGSFQSEDNGTASMYAYRISPISAWAVVGAAPLAELTGAVDQIEAVTILAIAGSIGLALIIGFWLIAMIGLPMSRMEAMMGLAAQGDFRGRLPIKGRDEMANVSLAFNSMLEKIGELLLETRQAVAEVGASSQAIALAAGETALSASEISSASEQIAQGAVGLASNSEHSSSRVEQMGTHLSDTLKLQQVMTTTASEVSDTCRQGRGTIDTLIRKSGVSEQQFHTVSDRIDGLHASTQSINDILHIMTDVSKKIKVLSLNATIEASRAGSMGAGFRVIADEIRKLADQSGASIGQVSDLTQSVRGEVSATVDAMADALPIYNELLSEVHAVNTVFATIEDHMQRLTYGSVDVTNAIKHLHETQSLLMASIEEVSAVSQQASASSEEVASLCSSQSVIADRLVALSDMLNLASMKLEDQMRNFQVDHE